MVPEDEPQKFYLLTEEELQRAIDLAHEHGQLISAAFIRTIIIDTLDRKIVAPSHEIEEFVREYKRQREERGALWKLLARVLRGLVGIG